MTLPSKRRLARSLGAVTAVAAVASLVAGATSARLSAQTTQAGGPNKFTAGTVTLTSAASVTCNVSALAPGDSTAAWFSKNASGSNNANGNDVQCTLPYTYSGTSAAYLALDLAVAGTAASPQTPYTTTAASGPSLTLSATSAAAGATMTVSTTADSGFVASHAVTVKVNGVSAAITSGGTTDPNGGLTGALITVPATLSPGSYAVSVSDGTTTGTSAPTFVVTAPALFDSTANGLQMLVQDSNGSIGFANGVTYTPQAGGGTALSNTSGAGSDLDLLINTTPVTSRTGTITLDYYLPDASTISNAYGGATTTVTMTVHAVQSANQTLPTGCASGHQCLAQTGFTWN